MNNKTQRDLSQYQNLKTERTIAQGVSWAREIEQKTQRMIGAYNQFVEARLQTAIDTLGCSPEEMELETQPLKDAQLVGTQILYVKGVPLLKIEAVFISETEVQFIATPIGNEA